jgi:hypothetical protein
MLFDAERQFERRRYVKNVQTRYSGEVRPKLLQDTPQGVPLEPEIHDADPMAGRNEGRGDVLQAERFGLKERSQPKLDGSRSRLEE